MTDPTSRLYTRTGDNGETGLFGPRRLPKDSLRIRAIGAVDEVNCALGLVRTGCADPAYLALVQTLQEALFELGAELADPAQPRLGAAHTTRLERLIDQLDAALPPLTAFILPGGSPAGAHCHLARSLCRRAERTLFALAREEPVNPESLRWLNRLSDLLFVLARSLNQAAGVVECHWPPVPAETAP
jgi:cob(I)alamin adenosyltransferase